VVAVVVLPLLVAAAAFMATPPKVAAAANLAEDWPTFLHDAQRSGASGETILTAAGAGQLKKRWAFLTGGVIAASPTIVGGVVYVGSWDGYEYAIDAKLGTLKWKTFVGQTTDPACKPSLIGVTSAAAVANGVVYVGGGDTYWYALDAVTGAVLWKVYTGDNSQVGAHYNWASPLLYNGSAYIGIASNCDAPLVQGQLLEVNLATHLVSHTVSFVPDGQVGGGVWTSPAVDAATNTIFVSTGTLNDVAQTLSEAIVSLDATTLAINGSWQLPRDQAGLDTDWGTSPTIFNDQNGRPLVAAANKNGVIYAFNRTNLAAGPVWTRTIAIGGDCPPCGDGSISSGTFAAGRLFYAGGNTTINGVGYRGSVRAFDPATGAVIWEHGSDQAVLPAIAYDNGMVLDAAGATLEVLDSNTGKNLFDYTSGAPIYSAPAVSGGMIYFGSGDGNLYGLYNGGPTAIVNDPNCPGGWTCQDIRNPPVGAESLANGVLTVTAGGDRIEGTGDRFRFIWQPVSGDAQITTQLLNQTVQGAGLGPQAGLMVRQSPDATSPFYAITAYPNDLAENLPLPAIRIWYRTSFGGTAIQSNKIYPSVYPRYMRIQRVGNVFMTGLSADGVNFQLQPGTEQIVVMPNQLMGGLATNSGSNTVTGTATYNFAATTFGPPTPAMTPTPTNHPCPAGWACQGVGDPSPVGDQVLNGSTWTLQGVGPDITNTIDQFHYVWQSMAADGTLSAHFTAQANTSPNAKAGLMLRQTLDWSSPYYGIFVTPGKGISVQWRTTANLRTHQVNVAGTVPQYFQLSRFTDTATASTYYTALTSLDGVTWNPVLGSTVALPMTGALLAGMAATANAPRVQSAVTVDSVNLSNTSARPASVCPTNWTCADIGTATLPGGQVFQNGTWTVQAGGQDIWGVYDGFRFISQPLPGDGTVSARVASQSGGGAWQKTGVMLRYSADPEAPYYGVFVTPQHGVVVQSRSVTGGASTQVLIPGATPAYLEAARSTDPRTGTTYYLAYTSPDGISWTPIPGSTVILQMPGFVLAGIASDAYVYGTASATLDQVIIGTQQASPSPICPSGWTCSDIGNPTPTGDQSVGGSNWTVEGGGADIWDVADSFRYAYQSIAGDGSVSAHLGSQTPTDAWAKAGVMMRASADPGSPYYAAFVTPGHGVAVQSRSAQGLTSNQMVAAGAVPTYLQIVRRATTFTAYTSADRVTWTAVPGSSTSLPTLAGTLLTGLAVTSHNPGQLSAVNFDTIVFGSSVPPPVISAVQASNISATAATISWTTDTLSDSQVDFGTTSAYGTSTTLDPTLVTGHSQSLSALTPNTTYHFQVKSRDASNQLITSPDITLTTVPSPCPAGWTCTDIGNPTPVGSETVSGGTWTVLGGGSDIWGTADSFQYEWQSLAGSGTVRARVAAQGNTDQWAKAGVMVRTGTDPAAGYYAVFVTPGHGIAVQYRIASGGTSFQVLGTGTAPILVEVARANDTFTAYTSADGVTWTAVAGSSVSLPSLTGQLLAGLAVTSHNAAALSTVTFDSVAFGSTPAAPLISGVQVSNILATSVAINWNTDMLADSQVNYGSTAAYGSSSAVDPTLVSNHSQGLSGLNPNTLYHYQALSHDSLGQLVSSGDFTFTTAPLTPTISNVQAAGVSPNQATISWTTDTASDSQVEYGVSTAYGSVSALLPALVTSHSVGLTVLSPNTTYHFRVHSRDGFGQVGTSLDFVFTTVIPPPPTISTVQATAISNSAATITWTTSTPANSQVNYGTVAGTYPMSTTLNPALETSHSEALTGLNPNTTYHYQVVSVDAYSQSVASGDLTFTTSPLPGVISNVQATVLSATSATVTWTTDTSSTSAVNYGATTAFGSSIQDSRLVTTHSLTLTGLGPNATYHYQAASVDAFGQTTTTTTDLTFVTPLPPAPVISAVQGTPTSSTGVTITWTTDSAASSQVNYGATSAYGNSTALDPSPVTAHSVAIAGLASNSTYHYQVASVDAYGQSTASSDLSFTTPLAAAPVITNVQATSLTNTGATITWSTSSPADSVVNYGTTAAYGNSTRDATLVTNHSQSLTSLTAGQSYHYQVVSVDAYGQAATSADFSFTVPPLPPTISAVQSTAITSSGATIGWTTSGATTSQVNYGTTTAYGSASAPDGALVTAHSAALSGLPPSTTIHYQVLGTDAYGQPTASADFSFTTLPAPPAVSNVQVSGISATAATISWTTSTPASSQVFYGPTAAYTASTTADPTLLTAHTQTLTGLVASSLYHFQVFGVDAYAQPGQSADMTFSTTSCPVAWTCADVGGPALAGRETFTGGTWTVSAGGTDIGGTADQFHFDYQQLAGNGSVTARVASQTNSSAFAKAGVMLRQTADPGSPYYAVVVTPSNGIRVQYRATQGSTSATLVTTGGVAPAYLDVIRSGSTFQAYTSSDGATWSFVTGSSINLSIAGPMIAGLAVTSHNALVLTTATLDGVVISTAPAPPPSLCPSAWSCADIGGALPAGNQSLTASVWGIQGGGADIGGTADQFHFVSRALAGDGSISGHVTTQTNTNAFAKAGVMLRQTADPGSPYYALVATPSNGLRVQYRATSGATSVTLVTIAGTVPTYLKVSRAGSTFTAYTSADGSTWALVPGSSRTILVTGAMLEGLAVTSHSVTAACTATLDTVAAS
jgi:PQQ-like domain